jgi:hypothetical protein
MKALSFTVSHVWKSFIDFWNYIYLYIILLYSQLKDYLKFIKIFF